MEKRPVSLTIIACVIIAFSLLSIVGLAMAGSPAMAKAIEQTGMSVGMYQAWVGLGVIISLACAYGIFKGQPWSRVLYLAWGIIGLVVSFYISPMKASVVIGLVILVIVCVFLWTNGANDWFQARGLMVKREPDRGLKQTFE